MSNFFGAGDPFDNPFFTRPFGSSFEDPSLVHTSSKGPLIEELLDSDAEKEQVDATETETETEKDKYNNPYVEHPDDQPNISKVERTQPRMRSVSFRRVTYGGINGTYYTATSTRKTASDGVVLEERKQADMTRGEAIHRISRGINDKGRSFTRKLNSDGKVDTKQTLHNLHEDELATFEQAWKGNADRRMPGWDSGFDLFQNPGRGDSGRGGWSLPFRESVRGLDHDAQTQSSSGGRTKKVVRINIE